MDISVFAYFQTSDFGTDFATKIQFEHGLNEPNSSYCGVVVVALLPLELAFELVESDMLEF